MYLSVTLIGVSGLLLPCVGMTAPDFEEAFERVENLVLKFKANEARYLSAEYQEAEARFSAA